MSMMSQLIRDASGDFACPNDDCWRLNHTRVRPPMTECPSCHTPLTWDTESVAEHERWTHKPEVRKK